MNLQEACLKYKKTFDLTDDKLATALGVSRSQIIKIMNGYKESLTASFLENAARIFRTSIDELLEIHILPLSMHIPERTLESYIIVDKDYRDLHIQKGDTLLIRPFVYDASKETSVIVLQQNNEKIVSRYSDVSQDSKGQVIYHVIGLLRTSFPGQDLGLSKGPKKSK